MYIIIYINVTSYDLVRNTNVCSSFIKSCIILPWLPYLICIRITLRWRHNGREGVSNHQPQDCLLSRLFTRRSKKTSKLRVTGLWAGISPVTGEFPAQRTSNAENVFIWWRHHVLSVYFMTAIMMTSSNGNIFHVTGPLRWIPLTKASDAEL